MAKERPKTVLTCFLCHDKTTDLEYTEIPDIGHGWICKKCQDYINENKNNPLIK